MFDRKLDRPLGFQDEVGAHEPRVPGMGRVQEKPWGQANPPSVLRVRKADGSPGRLPFKFSSRFSFRVRTTQPMCRAPRQ